MSWGAASDIGWCADCKTYYRPSAGEHICNSKDRRDNRAKLEAWLGEFTIKEG